MTKNWELLNQDTSNFEKTLTSFFIENQNWSYDATIYRYENGLDELSYLSEIIKATKPTKEELKKLKNGLKIMEKNIISYFTPLFRWDITQTSFPIPLSSSIRNELEQTIFSDLSAFIIRPDLDKYKLNEKWYYLNISFIKWNKWEIKLWKVKISENQEAYKNYEERVKNNETEATK